MKRQSAILKRRVRFMIRMIKTAPELLGGLYNNMALTYTGLKSTTIG
jgi:hypothetical protein